MPRYLEIKQTTHTYNSKLRATNLSRVIFDKNLTTQERTLLHSDINNHFNIY